MVLLLLVLPFLVTAPVLSLLLISSVESSELSLIDTPLLPIALITSSMKDISLFGDLTGVTSDLAETLDDDTLFSPSVVFGDISATSPLLTCSELLSLSLSLSLSAAIGSSIEAICSCCPAHTEVF